MAPSSPLGKPSTIISKGQFWKTNKCRAFTFHSGQAFWNKKEQRVSYWRSPSIYSVSGMWWFQLTMLCVLKITSVPFRADVNSIREFGAQSSWLRKRLCYSLPLLFLETCFPNKVGINLLCGCGTFIYRRSSNTPKHPTHSNVSIYFYFMQIQVDTFEDLGTWHICLLISTWCITSSKQNLRGILKPKIFN